MSCQWLSGLLVAQPCGMPASGGCGLCGRMLCPAHTLMGQAGPACPQCASTREDYPDSEDTEVAEARQEYFTQYGGGSQFGEAGYFSEADSAALRQSPVRKALPEDEPYDPMET